MSELVLSVIQNLAVTFNILVRFENHSSDKQYISNLPFQIFVKIAKLASSHTKHRQHLQPPKYSTCFRGKYLGERIHFFFFNSAA